MFQRDLIFIRVLCTLLQAKLLENLQWASSQGAGAAVPGDWNLPPEAMQAMGLDAGDYVMYAIVEETILPPNYLPEQQYGVRESCHFKYKHLP